MVWSPGAVAIEFRDVPQRYCFSMLFYTLLHFWLGTQKFFFFYMSFVFNELLSEIEIPR